MKRRVLYNLHAIHLAPIWRDLHGTLRRGRFNRHRDSSHEEVAEHTARKRSHLDRLQRVVTQDEVEQFRKYADGEMPLSAIADCLGIDRANAWRTLRRWLQDKRIGFIALSVEEAVSNTHAGWLINPRTGEETPIGSDSRCSVSEPGSVKHLSPRPDSQEILNYIKKNRKALCETDNTHLRIEREPETGEWCLEIIHLFNPSEAVERLRRVAEAAEQAIARSGGCIIDPRTCMEVQAAGADDFWVVGYPGRDRGFTSKPGYPQLLRYLHDHEDVLFGLGETAYLWAGYNRKARKWGLDVIHLLSLEAALEFAAVHPQEQVFHAHTGENRAVAGARGTRGT